MVQTRIRFEMFKRGLRNKDLATAVGGHPTYVSQATAGKRACSERLRLAIAKEIGLSPDEAWDELGRAQFLEDSE